MHSDIWVDFNDIDAAGRTLTLEKFAARPLEIGERVRAGDEDGNVCDAIVLSREPKGLLALSLDMGTFRPCKGSRRFAKA